MDDYRPCDACFSLCMCDILSTRTIHSRKTKYKNVLSLTSIACSWGLSYGYHDDTSTEYDPNHRTEFDNVLSYLKYPLHACHEDKMDNKKSLFDTHRLSIAPLDIRRRCLRRMTRTSYFDTHIYPCFYFDTSHTSLCCSVIYSKYF